MSDFLSDAEMHALDSQGHAKDVQMPQPAGSAGAGGSFISDQDMSGLESQGHVQTFHPSQLPLGSLGGKPASVEPDADLPGAAMAGLDHFSNAVSAGYLPQIKAATAPAVDHTLYWAWKHGLVPGLDPKNAPDSYEAYKDNKTYVQRRDEAAKSLQDESAAHPTASIVGSIGGALNQAIMMGPLLGGGSAAAEGVGTLQGLAPRLLKASALGAGVGAAQNPGDVEGQISPLQLEDRAKNAATGGIVGGLTQGAVEGISGIGNALKNAPESLKNFAEEKAVKTTGASANDFKNAQLKGQVGPTGRVLLDEGIVTPFATPKTVANRLGQAIEDKSSQLNSLIGNAEGATQDLSKFSPAQQASLKAAEFNPKTVAENLKQQIIDKYPSVPRQEIQPALDKIDAWLGSKQGVMSPSQVQSMKQQMGRFLKDSDFYTQPQSFGKEGILSVRRALKEGVENSADAYANVLGQQGGQVKSTNQALGQLLQANKMVQGKMARDSANRAFGLTDSIMGAGGADVGAKIAGGPGALIGGAIGGIGNKLSRTFGNSLMATSADTASKFLQNNSDTLSKVGTPVLNAIKSSPASANLAMQSLGQRENFTGQDQLQKQQDYQMLQNPQLLNLMKSNPQLIETIQNPNLRTMLRARLGMDRNPSGQMNPAPVQNKVVPQEAAQQQFIKGNQ
jgi:hypothetical protein